MLLSLLLLLFCFVLINPFVFLLIISFYVPCLISYVFFPFLLCSVFLHCFVYCFSPCIYLFIFYLGAVFIDKCRRVETQLQFINIVSFTVSYRNWILSKSHEKCRKWGRISYCPWRNECLSTHLFFVKLKIAQKYQVVSFSTGYHLMTYFNWFFFY